MAGIAGIYCADGRAAEVADLKRMAAAAEHRGPDGITYWNGDPSGAPKSVAFAHLQFCTTPESLQERQPLVALGGDVCLVWNGRVDNREELRAALEASGATPADETDPGFVLAAYLAWGEECLQRIVGDFALVVWDGRQRRLWCARDYIGVRPFYYFWDGKTFVFGPEIRAMLAHPLVSLKIKEGMVGEYLANAITSREETLYADIRRLRSGSTLTIDASGSLRVDSWWKPELSLLEYRTDEEYAEHFRELFDQSIRAQIRCNAGWGIELSGGLDSSSIAVSARAVLDESGAKDAPIYTFSVVSPGKPWDESEDIAAVVGTGGLEAKFLKPLKADLEFFRERAAFSREFAGSPNGEPMFLPMANAAKRQGIRVFLNGIGGDEWLDGRLEHLADLAAGLLRPGALRELLNRARSDWREYSGIGRWQVFLVRQLLAAAAPDWVVSRRRKRRLEREGIFSREFLRRTKLADRIFVTPDRETRRFVSRAQRAIFEVATSASQALALEGNDRDAATAGVELRFPFFDRRLAEYCLRIPEDQRQRGAVWKRMLRNAMAGRLPERVRTKANKAEFSDLFRALFYDPPTQERVRHLTIPRHTDWMNRDRLQHRIEAVGRPDHPARTSPWPLWRVLSADLWFEQVVKESESGNGAISMRSEQ